MVHAQGNVGWDNSPAAQRVAGTQQLHSHYRELMTDGVELVHRQLQVCTENRWEVASLVH
jgi:hypothetical protein